MDGLLAVLLAPSCLACGSLLEQPTAGPVCGACWHSIHPLSPPLCERCGEPAPFGPDRRDAGSDRRDAGSDTRDAYPTRVVSNSDGGQASGLSNDASGLSGNVPLCARCRHEPSPVSIGRAAGAYEGALRQLLHAFKYEGRRSLARPLGTLLRQRCREALAGADLAVPVPLHWRRRLTRGFNQAEDLARTLGLPVCLALRRVRATRPQFGLRPGERRRNVGAAFAPRRNRLMLDRRTPVAGACVVLVDDLATTGATLRECAEALKGMGAREVRTVTVARALSRRPG